MVTPADTDGAIELIQLALTPVFLIVGIGQMLNVVTSRVARIIDRSRWFDEQILHSRVNLSDRPIQDELKTLDKRMKYAHHALTFLTGAAFLICLDVIVLLTNGLLGYDLEKLLLVLFILAILFITGGLLFFFLEVSLASATQKVNATQK